MVDEVSIAIEFCEMRSLTEEERKILSTLTLKVEGLTSLFSRWIRNYYNQEHFYTSILYREDRIIGWAAACMNHEWNLGFIGVFVTPEFRGKGFAKKLLTVLVRNIKTIHPQYPEYLDYERGKERLFGELIEENGFLDVGKHGDEYYAKRNRIIGNK